MEPQAPDREKGRRNVELVYVLIVAGIIIALTSVAITYGARSTWIGHAVTSLAGLVLLGVVIFTGAILGGRITRFKIPELFKIHRAASVAFAILMVGAFLLGIVLVLRNGDDPVLASNHGIIGLAIAALALVQVTPSLLVRNRLGIRKIHLFAGYALAFLVTIQILYGFAMVFHLIQHTD